MAASAGVERLAAVVLGLPIAVLAALLVAQAAPPGAPADGPGQGVGVVVPAKLGVPTDAMVALGARGPGPGVPVRRGTAAKAGPAAVAAARVAGLAGEEVVEATLPRLHPRASGTRAGNSARKNANSCKLGALVLVHFPV